MSLGPGYLLDWSALDARFHSLAVDTVALRGVGGRFAEELGPSPDLATVRDLFGAHGAGEERLFTDLTLLVNPALAERLEWIDPDLVKHRLLHVAVRLVGRHLRGFQGIALLRYEEGRDCDCPVVHLLLSPRLTDGSSAPRIHEDDWARIERTWQRETYRSFGVTTRWSLGERSLGNAPDETRLRELEGQWREASREFREVFRARLLGQATPDALASALAKGRKAQEAWRVFAQAERDPLLSHPVIRLEFVHLRVDGGGEYCRSLSAKQREDLVRGALEETGLKRSSLPEVVSYCSGKDLGVMFYASSAEAAALREGLSEKVVAAMERQAEQRRLPIQDVKLGPAHLLSDRVSDRDHGRERDRGLLSGNGLSVALEVERPVDRRPELTSSLTIRVADAEQFFRLSVALQREVLETTVSHVFPELRKTSGSFLARAEGKALELKIHLAPGSDPEGGRTWVSEARVADALQRAAASHLRSEGDRKIVRAPAPSPPSAPRHFDPGLKAVSITVVEHTLPLTRWNQARLVEAVHRVEGGAVLLSRFPPAQRKELVQRAVDLAYPVKGARPPCSLRERGGDLEVRVPLRDAGRVSWWQLKEMEAPTTSARFSQVLRHVVTEGRSRGAESGTSKRTLLEIHRAIAGPMRHLSQAREWVENPLQAMKRAGLGILSGAAPAPLRALRTIGRTVGRFVSQED